MLFIISHINILPRSAPPTGHNGRFDVKPTGLVRVSGALPGWTLIECKTSSLGPFLSLQHNIRSQESSHICTTVPREASPRFRPDFPHFGKPCEYTVPYYSVDPAVSYKTPDTSCLLPET